MFLFQQNRFCILSEWRMIQIENLNYKAGREIRHISALDAIFITVLNGRLSPQGFELDLYVPNKQAEQNLHRFIESENIRNIRVELGIQIDASSFGKIWTNFIHQLKH